MSVGMFADVPRRGLMASAALLALAGCTVAPPSGPAVVAMPGTGKTYEEFQADDYACRQAAQAQVPVAPTPDQSTGQVAGSALLGGAIGAAAGAALGAAGGNAGAGAAIGGAMGAITGTAVGANNAQAYAGNLQERYDIAYTQCMYAKGNKVPAAAPAPVYAPSYGYAPYPYYAPPPSMYFYYRPRYWRRW